MAWLDIQEPTADDIAALACVFEIGANTLRRLLAGAALQVLDPECVVEDRSLYLCWAEMAGTDASTSQYILHGSPIHAAEDAAVSAASPAGEKAAAAAHTGIASSDTTAVAGQKRAEWPGGYVPVHPWMQPSATQVLSRLNLPRYRVKSKYADTLADPQAEAVRLKQAHQVLELLSKPVITNKERMRAVLQRWGSVREQWWREVLDHTRDGSNSSKTSAQGRAQRFRQLAEQLGQGARETLGYHTVQLWVRGPIVLSLHRHSSEVIAEVARELAPRDARLLAVEPLAVVQGLVERWVQAAASRLPVLDQWSDRLDHELTHPVRILSIETANWSPVIARGRKAGLALLRRCQLNESVLRQLCSAARTLLIAPDSRGGRNCAYYTMAHRPLLSPAHHPLVHDIAGRGIEHQLGALHEQHARIADLRGMYKKAEQRLSRLHSIMLDRQRLRIIKTQKDIHRYFRILVTVELVFLPIELWYNLDNLNGITTPGRLQPFDASDEDFWLTVLGMFIWAAVAIALYSLYTKYFELRHARLRAANLSDLHFQQRAIAQSKSWWRR
ncbi:hypothetical protein LPJ61_004413 [Coemansia biformis]|uniref:Uncharacterized protein n=1 Tax=Coemansia biformis TaxID=1286918 RepID=A0A9W7YAV6_9FUNG|nr:hypothetical protein LPJ61_004413 [Coemansia biformis]